MAITILLLALSPAAFDAPANAATMLLRSCVRGATNGGDSAAGWEAQVMAVGWSKVSACPRELGFDTSAPASQGARAVLSYVLAPWSADSMRITLEGGATGAGMEYRLTQCDVDALDCRSLRRIDPRANGDPPETLSLPLLQGEYPLIRIEGECVAETCPGASGLRFHDVVFSVHDDQAPSLGTSAWPYHAWATDPDWVKPDQLPLDFSFADDLVGIGAASAALDARAPFWSFTGCDLALDAPIYLPQPPQCASHAVVSLTGGRLDTSGLADGVHRVTLTARDMAGNAAAPVSYWFAMDGTPPATPEDPVVSGLNAYHWTSDSLSKVTWVNRGEVARSNEQSGLALGYYDLEPLSGQSENPAPRSFLIGGPQVNVGPSVMVPTDGRWALYVWLEDAAGNLSGKLRIEFGRDTDVPTAPAPTPNPWVNRAALASGFDQRWTQVVGPEIESGICGYAMTVNSAPDSEPAPVITVPGAVLRAPLPADAVPGEQFVHLRAISCSGKASPTATTPLKVDDTPPTLAPDISAVGGWSREPLTIGLRARDAESGVADVAYRLGDDPPSIAPGNDVTLTLGEGRHTLRYWASDNAGNTSEPRTRALNVDQTSPSGHFLPRDQSHPNEIEADVYDALSGVASAQIQYRRIGDADPAWHGLATIASAQSPDIGEQRLSAEVPDRQLADGEYALRVVVSDVAGNAGYFDRGGVADEPMRLTLPLRERWTVTAGTALSATACKSKRNGRAKHARCRARGATDAARQTRLIAYADAATLTGDLRNVSGTPCSGARLKIYAAVSGLAPELVTSTVTDDAGRYAVAILRGPTRLFTVVYAGDDKTLPTKATAELRVSAAATLRVNHASTRVGRTITLSGRLASGGAWLPPTGKLIDFEFRNGDVWQSVLTARADSNGRFRESYAFRRALDKPIKVVFRAVMLAEGMWPFEENATRPVVVTVRP